MLAEVGLNSLKLGHVTTRGTGNERVKNLIRKHFKRKYQLRNV